MRMKQSTLNSALYGFCVCAKDRFEWLLKYISSGNYAKLVNFTITQLLQRDQSISCALPLFFRYRDINDVSCVEYESVRACVRTNVGPMCSHACVRDLDMYTAEWFQISVALLATDGRRIIRHIITQH